MFDEGIETQDTFDTKYIQEKSVLEFMDQLGFYATFSSMDIIDGFRSKYEQYGNVHNVSFSTAIKLHNGSFDYYDFHGNLKGAFTVIDKYSLNKARAAKIVENAKLQYSKKKGLIVQSHIVKFVDESYYDLFFD